MARVVGVARGSEMPSGFVPPPAPAVPLLLMCFAVLERASLVAFVLWCGPLDPWTLGPFM